MTIINLMPHAFTLVSGGQVALTIAPSGQIARCAETTVADSSLVVNEGDIPVCRKTYGETLGLPAPAPGVTLIVSALVRQANPHRKDLYSPGDLVRNTDGQPIGAAGLVGN
jgi:hypothetical protein